MANVHFLTGFPGFLGKQLLRRLVERDRKARIWVLVQPRFVKAAKRELATYPQAAAARVRVLIGDIVDMHLGLSGEEYRRLTSEVKRIYHLAAMSSVTSERRQLEQVNVQGVAHILELARDAPNLVRLGHVSTVQVAGERRGVIEEEELEEGQHFRNAYEESKFRGEILARRAMEELPISVYRPSTVIGDSRTGTTGPRGGPYNLTLQLVTSALRSSNSLPGHGSFPLNVVPSDFVADAILELSHRPAAAGKTFHLVDPNPMSARKVHERIAGRARQGPRPGPAATASAALLRLPLVERLLGRSPRSYEHLEQLAIYGCRNTLEHLDESRIRCPPLHSYLDRLVGYVEEQVAEQALVPRREAPIDDPLAPLEPALAEMAVRSHEP